MGKNRRYAGRRTAAKQGGMAGGAEKAGADRGANGQMDGRFERDELSMMIYLAQWRYNMLAVTATFDGEARRQRAVLKRLMRKLDRIVRNGGENG